MKGKFDPERSRRRARGWAHIRRLTPPALRVRGERLTLAKASRATALHQLLYMEVPDVGE